MQILEEDEQGKAIEWLTAMTNNEHFVNFLLGAISLLLNGNTLRQVIWHRSTTDLSSLITAVKPSRQVASRELGTVKVDAQGDLRDLNFSNPTLWTDHEMKLEVTRFSSVVTRVFWLHYS